MSTQLSKYPCSECGRLFIPKYHLKGKAIMRCPTHGLFETDVKKSLRFRKICSRIAKNMKRTQGSYSSLEKKFKKFLDELHFREGIDYIHNCRVKNNDRYYWLDFYFPRTTIGKPVVIEINPRLWHNRWNREKSDNSKTEFLESNGVLVFNLLPKDLDNVSKIRNFLSFLRA